MNHQSLTGRISLQKENLQTDLDKELSFILCL